MYGMLFLVTLTSLWLFVRLINRPNTRWTLTALSAVNLVLIFTHYYGWVIVALEVLYALIWKRKRVRSVILATGILAVCFSPWVWIVSKAARVNPSRVNFIWNRPPPASELAGYYGNLNGALSYRWRLIGPAVVMIIFLAPVIAWGWRIIRERQENKSEARVFWWMASFAFAPVALAFIASHVLPQPVWAFRYLIIAAPAYLLMIAVAAYRIKSRVWRIGAVGLILCWSTLSGVAQMANPGRIAWEPLVRTMIQAETARAPVKVFVTDSNIGNTIQYYLDQAKEGRFEMSYVDRWEAVSEAHFWVAFVRYANETESVAERALHERGYETGEGIEFDNTTQRAIILPVWQRR